MTTENYFDRVANSAQFKRGLDSLRGVTPQQRLEMDVEQARIDAFKSEAEQRARAAKAQRALKDTMAKSGGQMTPELIAAIAEVDPMRALEMRQKMAQQTQRQNMLSQIVGGEANADDIAAAGVLDGDPNLLKYAEFRKQREKEQRIKTEEQQVDDLINGRSPPAPSPVPSASPTTPAPTAPAPSPAFPTVSSIQQETQALQAERERLAKSRFADKPQVKSAIEDIDKQLKAKGAKMQKLSEAESVAQQAEQVSSAVNELLAHPGFESAVGSKIGETDYLLGVKSEPLEGTDSAGFMAFYRQTKGQTFLQGYEMLKGGGPITDIEGKKAEEALNAMDTAASEEDFKKAAARYTSAVKQGARKLMKEAGLPPLLRGDVAVNNSTGERLVWSGTQWQAM